MTRGPRALAATAVLALAVAFAQPPAAGAQDARAASGPPLSARAAILVQPDTGDVVARRNATAPLLIASTTKLMTALVTREHSRLGRHVRAIDYHATPAESLAGLSAGERLTIRDLLRGLLLPSGNDAAATLAVRVAGSQRAFVRLMNARARQLGLADTHFANPIGLDDPDNHSSAEDLAKLALVVLRDPFLRRTVDMTGATLHTSDGPLRVVNRDTLVDDVPWMTGVKTGHTERAGYVLVGSATRHGVRLVSVVIGDPSEMARDADTLTLMHYGLRRYHRVTAVPAGRVLARARLDHRDARVGLVAARPLRVVARRGRRPDVRVVGAPAQLSGPLPRGHRVGTVEVRHGGRVLVRAPLVTAAPVAAASLGDRISSVLPPWLLAVLAALVAVGSLQIATRRRRAAARRRTASRERRGSEAA